MTSERIDSVHERIRRAAERAGRNPNEIRLMAVTKQATVEQMTDAITEGIDLIGENYVQDAADKFRTLPKVEKHLIGHLQSNKVKSAVGMFDCIQTIDSIKIAKAINDHCIDRVMPVFIEVNPGEESKSGVSFSDVGVLYNQIVKLPNIKVRGLMGIAPYGDLGLARDYFRKLRLKAQELGLKELSIGMSEDFEIAIEEGATMVRVGRALFS